MRRTFDIDIDVRGGVDKTLYGVRCAIYNQDSLRLQAHPSGLLIEEVPQDPITGLSCINYTDCDTLGIYKVDLLTNNSYNVFKDQAELNEYRDMETDFSLLQIESVCRQLPHIGNNYDMVKLLKPSSISELADVLALMRPGKMHLIDDYQLPHKKQITIENLYRSSTSGMFFKKSHAVSYAVMICTVLNKLKEMMIY